MFQRYLKYANAEIIITLCVSYNSRLSSSAPLIKCLFLRNKGLNPYRKQLSSKRLVLWKKLIGIQS